MPDTPPKDDPVPAFDPAERVATLGGPTVGGGTLPSWFLRSVVAGSALVALAVLLATGSFTIVLLLILTAAFALPTAYFWSRIAEGRRQAMDRLVTLGIVTGFGLAVVPLFALLYEVIKRGVARFDGSFFTESARGVIGPGGGAEHAISGRW